VCPPDAADRIVAGWQRESSSPRRRAEALACNGDCALENEKLCPTQDVLLESLADLGRSSRLMAYDQTTIEAGTAADPAIGVPCIVGRARWDWAGFGA